MPGAQEVEKKKALKSAGPVARGVVVRVYLSARRGSVRGVDRGCAWVTERLAVKAGAMPPSGVGLASLPLPDRGEAVRPGTSGWLQGTLDSLGFLSDRVS